MCSMPKPSSSSRKSNLRRSASNESAGSASSRGQKKRNTRPAAAAGGKTRIWLCFLAGSLWSLYSIHNTSWSSEYSTILQHEIEQEGQYIASLFEKTAIEAREVFGDAPLNKLFGDDSSSSSVVREALQVDDSAGTSTPAAAARTFSSFEAIIRASNASQTVQNQGPDPLDFSSIDPNHHHAIIIPYRDRQYHLEKFIEHMGPYLKRNFPDDSFELWVVEQDDEQLFNRAWLVNVGIARIRSQNRHYEKEIKVGTKQTVPPPPVCIVLHDVDLVPTVDGVPYTNCSRPLQLGTELAHFNYSIPYPVYTGGVGPSMKMEHWMRINGMSNDYFGK
jgi:hypothetical protein